MHLPDEPESLPQINVVPMIDVIFVVLVLFILASLFLDRSESLPVDLPNAENSQKQELQDHLTLTITASGNLQLQGQAITLDRLPAEIQAYQPRTRPLLVVIRADKRIFHGRVVAVMDSLRTLENIQLGIATDPLLPSASP